MTKPKVLIMLLLAPLASLLLAPLASGQLVYDSVRVKVEPGVECPSGWTASTESITIPTLGTPSRFR